MMASLVNRSSLIVALLCRVGRDPPYGTTSLQSGSECYYRWAILIYVHNNNDFSFFPVREITRVVANLPLSNEDWGFVQDTVRRAARAGLTTGCH